MNTINQPLCDVLIPVYNALPQTARCIQSVLKYSTVPYRLVLINDGSDWATTAYLREIAAVHSHVILLENEKNIGFLGTVNRALAYGLNTKELEIPKFKLILNSDTIVSKGWLEAFDRCFSSDERIGLATAVSNNAENISVQIPEGHNVHTMAEAAAKTVLEPRYPDVTTAVGFCMAVRSNLLSEVGLFDEAFAPGYGEESDYHFKVLCKGYRSVVVSDCFVYHENHASFSSDKAALVEKNRPIFDYRWKIIYNNELAQEQLLGEIANLKKITEYLHEQDKIHDVLFVIPTAKLFGGIIVVYEICRRLIEEGLDANVLILSEVQDLPLDLPFVPYFRPDSMWPSKIPPARLYVATHYETAAYAFIAHMNNSRSKIAYLVQGYEPWFPGAGVEEVLNTLRAIPNRVVVSEWLATMLSRWNLQASKIPNGINPHCFYPSTEEIKEKSAREKLTLMCLLRNDPQGGSMLAAGVLRKIKKLCPRLKICAIGNLCYQPPFDEIVDEKYEYAGQREIHQLYRKSDVFVDFSMVQGFGLMGLEAMASGVATVMAATGGVQEYANSLNSVLVSPGDEMGFVKALVDLLANPKKLRELKQKGLDTAKRFNWEQSAERYSQYFRHILAEGAETGIEQRTAMMHYLFGRLSRGQELRNVVTKVRQIFISELENLIPSPALEVLRLRMNQVEFELICTTHEGLALVALYEKARAQITHCRVESGKAGGIQASDNDMVSVVRSILSSNQGVN